MPVEKLTPSFTFTEERLQALQAVVPEAFADGQVNWETLKAALEPFLEDEGSGTEHFGLFWPGKRQARRLAAQPSKGTLRPVKGQGVNEDITHNLFIEGDNLEVLKLLQKSYAGRAKLIYIDPPYNTGNDFVYKDDFAEPLEEYLQRTGQADAEGLLTTNPKAGGRFHSNWLNMMLPRLMLARTLLSEDGVIFVSIDDNEVHNLRQLMDEVFGEENFVCEFVWEKKKKPAFLHNNVGKIIDYIICYLKNCDQTFPFSVETTTEGKKYPLNNAGNPLSKLFFPPNTVRFGINDQTIQAQNMSEGNIKTKLIESVTIKNGFNYNELVLEGEWRYSQAKINEIISAGEEEIYISKIPFRPNHIKKGGEIKKMKNCLSPNHYEMETNEDATTQITNIFGNVLFENPKPVKLIRTLLKAVSYNSDDAIVLDFFSGSCTTAQAVLELNREDGGNRRFIMVQMPEPTPPDSAARQAGYKTIADIGKERIRRVIAKLAKQPVLDRDPPEDLGFAVYRLDRSHFKAWQDYDGTDPAQLDDLFSHHQDPLIAGWHPRALLDEVLLLQGFPLDSRRTRLNDFTHNALIQVECDWFSVRLFVCLDPTINPATIDALPINADDKFICLDSALTDQTKQQLADRCTLVVL